MTTPLYVINLADSGSGTLRDCFARAQALGGNCSIVPLVTGDTTLSSVVELTGAVNVSLVGIPGWRIVGHQVKFTNCDNVLVYNVGNYGSAANANTQNFTFEGCDGVCIAHCAGFWATDDPFGFEGSINCTVQDCLIAECLQDTFGVDDPLSKGGIVTGGSTDVTWLRTVWVHCGSRLPLFSTTGMAGGARLYGEAVNVYWYNNRHSVMENQPSEGPTSINAIGCGGYAGPDTFAGYRQLFMLLANGGGILPDTQYVTDCLYHISADCVWPNMALPGASEQPEAAQIWPAMSPTPLALSGVAAMSQAAGLAYALDHAGTLVRDSHQERVIQDFRNKLAGNPTGAIIANPSEVGG